MDISQRGIDLIVSFEGKHKKLADGRYQAYLDTLAVPNVWTIYCGLTKGVSSGMICTEEEGERMFRKELAVYEDAVERLVSVPLNQNQFDALVSFVYNCGPGALQESTLLKLLNEGKYETVTAQLMRWVNAGGKRYEGLARRRAAEGSLFMEPMPEEAVSAIDGVEEAPAPAPMPQKVEEAPAGKVIDVVTQSWTLRGAALAFLGAITNGAQSAYDWMFGVVKDAGPEIATLKQTVGPLDPLIKLTPTVLYAVIIIGLVIVAVRKIKDHVEGKAV